jgi:uncharacterized protein YndB with AHSA1/START domain
MIHIVPMNWIDMKEVFSEIEIQAPAGRVWQVLTDFANYSEWNPSSAESAVTRKKESG